MSTDIEFLPPDIMKPSDLCLPMAPNILHAECQKNAVRNGVCPVGERHKDLWKRILSFCDASMMFTIRCTSQSMNRMVLEALRDAVGFSSAAVPAESPVVFALTDGLMDREVPRIAAGNGRSIENVFAARADALVRREWCTSKAMEHQISSIAMREGCVDPYAVGREWRKLTHSHDTRGERRSLSAEDHCMEEWLTYLNEARRAQFNIRHGLFNYYSTKSSDRSFFLPDGTLCVVSELENLQLYSRRCSTSSGLSRKEENTQTLWTLQTACFFDQGILSSFYDIYSGNIYVQTDENLWEVRVTTPSMRAVEQRVKADEEDDKGKKRKEEEIKYKIERKRLTEYISTNFKISDSMGLPQYRWNARNVRFAVKSIRSGDERGAAQEEDLAFGLERGPKNTYVVYEDGDETQKVFLDSEPCPYLVSSDLSMLYVQMWSELNKSLNDSETMETVENAESVLRDSSSSNDNDIGLRISDATVSPYLHRVSSGGDEGREVETDTGNATATAAVREVLSSSIDKPLAPLSHPFPAESHPADTMEMNTSFVFTALPSVSLLLGSSSVEEHLLIPQKNFTSSAISGAVDYVVSTSMFVSVGQFKKITTADRVPKCEKTIFDVNQNKNTEDVCRYHWMLDSDPSLEESEVLFLGNGSDNVLSRIRVRRCLVSKLAKFSTSVFAQTDNGNPTLQKTEIWFLCRGYAYYISGSAERLLHFPSTGCVFPRPWSPDLLAKLSLTNDGHKEPTHPSVMLRGSNGVEWRPRYDGHPYFNQPFVFSNFDTLTMCVPGYKKPLHKDDMLSSSSGANVGLTIALQELINENDSRLSASTVTLSHAERYAQIINQTCALTISKTNAYFILATRDGRLVLLAPSLSMDPYRSESLRDRNTDDNAPPPEGVATGPALVVTPATSPLSGSTHSATVDRRRPSSGGGGAGEKNGDRSDGEAPPEDDHGDVVFGLEREGSVGDGETERQGSGHSSGGDENDKEDRGGFIGFGGTTCETYRTRHYRCTSLSSSMTSVDASLLSVLGVPRSVGLGGLNARPAGGERESPSRKCRFEMDDIFGSRFRMDRTLQYIQSRYLCMMEQWDRQMKKPRNPRAAASDETAGRPSAALQNFLRVPLYACFLKVERDFPRKCRIKEMHADGWKLTTLSAYMDVVIYDLSALAPPANPHPMSHDHNEARRSLQYPCITPLISLGLFDKPIRTLADTSRLQRALFSLASIHHLTNRAPSVEWQDGMLLVRSNLQLLNNVFLLDFSPSFDIPAFLRKKLPPTLLAGAHGPLPESAWSSSTGKDTQEWLAKHDMELRGHQADIHRVIRECSQYQEPENNDDLGLTTSEIESVDYYPLDLLCCACTEEGLLQHYISYDAFVMSQKSRSMVVAPSLDLVTLTTKLTGDPPHFKSLRTEFNVFVLYNILSPVCLLLLIPYVMLNAVNLSSKNKVMPYVGVFPFILPSYILLLIVQGTPSFHRPFRTPIRFIVYTIITLLLAVLPLLFALKHDGYLSDRVTWWEVSLVVVAAALLFIPFAIWDWNQPDLEHPTIRPYIAMLVFAIISVLLAIYFDYHSPSNPAAPLFPLAIAFIPLFLGIGLFFLFRMKEEVFDEAEVLLKCIALIIGAVLLFFVLFPTIVFVVNYSSFWKWYDNPVSQKPSCIVPAVFVCIAIGFAAMIVSVSCIRIIYTICVS